MKEGLHLGPVQNQKQMDFFEKFFKEKEIIRQVPSGISPTWNFFIKEIKRHCGSTPHLFFLYQAVADIFFFSDLYILHIFEVF